MARKNLKVPESLFLALRDDKPDKMTWPTYLETRCLTTETVGDVSHLSYDDVKAACGAALRDECAPEVLER